MLDPLQLSFLIIGGAALAFFSYMCGAEYGYSKCEKRPLSYLQRDDIEAALRAAQETPDEVSSLADLLLSTPIQRGALGAQSGRCQDCDVAASHRAVTFNGTLLVLCSLHLAAYTARGRVAADEEWQESP